MIRKLVAVLVFAMAIPAAAFACSDHAQAKKSADGQTVLLAQNTPPEEGGKKGKKAPKSGPAKKKKKDAEKM